MKHDPPNFCTRDPEAFSAIALIYFGYPPYQHSWNISTNTVVYKIGTKYIQGMCDWNAQDWLDEFKRRA